MVKTIKNNLIKLKAPQGHGYYGLKQYLWTVVKGIFPRKTITNKL